MHYLWGQAARQKVTPTVEDSREEKKPDRSRKHVDFERFLSRIEGEIGDRFEQIENRYCNALSKLPICHEEIVETRKLVDAIHFLITEKKLKR